MHPIDIFFSYAHEDEFLMNHVRRQLIVYDRQKIIRKWYDRKILPGDEWERVIDERINRAKIILLFVSPYFIESKYCYNTEMEIALDRHEAGDAIVIPIILRPCPWPDSPLGNLQALPKDGKPITEWSNRDKATLSVAEGIMKVVRELIKRGEVATIAKNTPPRIYKDTKRWKNRDKTRVSILIVDNDQKYAHTRKELLEHEGYNVIISHNVADARIVLDQGKVHLAIIDIHLENDGDEKDLSGLTLAKSPLYPNIPKIVITAFPSIDIVKEVLKRETSDLPLTKIDFLSKLEDPIEMVETVRRILSLNNYI